MSKWNKATAQPLTEQFLENEERRKQMIIEAARRRKEKEKRVLEQEEMKRRDEEQALVRHKQEKKDAYVKYLRNNIYDKYEDAKRKKKEASDEIKPTAKWKKRTPEKGQPNDQQLEALDLEVNVELANGLVSGFDDKPTANPSSNTRKMLNEEFQKEWQEQLEVKEDLLSSKLLDSLDLDVGTLNRDFQMKELIKQKHKTLEQKPEERKDEIRELRDLIGYESIVVGHQPPKIEEKESVKEKEKEKEKLIKPKQAQRKPETNEVELLNELKHKKEARVLNWAIQQEQEAEDLFSECSSIARKKQPKALKELNEQLKNKKVAVVANNKKALETIKEAAREKIASREKKTNSTDAPKEPERVARVQQRTFQNSREKEEKPERMNSKSIEKRANTTTVSNPTFPKKELPKKQEKKEVRTATTGFASDKNSTRVRTTSKQKKQPEQKPLPAKADPPKPIVKPEPPKKLFGNLPPLPAPAKAENNSIATHDMQIDVESFIKQDLINLNERERELQEELRQLHKQKREDLNEVYSKYGIRTDYKHSSELTGQSREGEDKYYQSEADIEESLQNLENLEIRRNLESRNKPIREVTEENSSDSIINPFSSSEVLCNQILKLAKNIERFDRKPAVEDPNGYNQMHRNKRNNSGNKTSEVSRVTRDSKKEREAREDDQEELVESQQVSQLSRPPFIYEPSEVSSKLRREQERPEKIHVNAHLLRGLLDDD